MTDNAANLTNIEEDVLSLLRKKHYSIPFLEFIDITFNVNEPQY